MSAISKGCAAGAVLLAGVCVAVTSPSPPQVMVCTTKAVHRVNNPDGTFAQIDLKQWMDNRDNPESPYYKSVPAIFVKGYGTMCQISDVATYGGDPAKFKDAGYTVNEVGDPTPKDVSPIDWSAYYEFWVPALKQ